MEISHQLSARACDLWPMSSPHAAKVPSSDGRVVGGGQLGAVVVGAPFTRGEFQLPFAFQGGTVGDLERQIDPHTHTSQSMAAYSQRSLSRLVSCPGRPESGNRAPVNTPWRLKLLILMRVKETGLPLWDRNHTFHLFIGKSMSGAAVSLWVSLMAFLECSIGEFQWTKYRIYSLKYHLSYFYNVSVRDKGWGWINIYTIHQK